MMFPKEKPWRSEAYLEYVRNHPCCDCEWPPHLKGIEAHHIFTGGGSTKCGDEWTVPLCNFYARKCHNKADKTPGNSEKYKPIAERLFKAYRGDKPKGEIK